MKTLLLISKFIATKERSEIITLEHFVAASQFIEPMKNTDSNKKYSKLINAVKKLTVSESEIQLLLKYETEVTEYTLEKTANEEFIDFAKEVGEFLESVTKNGVPYKEDFLVIRTPPATAKLNYHKQIKSIEALKNTLLNEVFGQDQVIEDLTDSLTRSSWDEHSAKPSGIFLFLGPPATGKTFLAETLSHHIKSYEFKSFDMTQYTNSNEAFGLVGGKKSYDDSTPGQLTQFVKKNPKSIILFDEFEKAHTQVLLSLLQLLSTGFIIDEHTEEKIDFRDTIIIFTSNLGKSLYNNRMYLEQLQKNPNQAKESLLANIATATKIERDRKVKAIPAEFLSRLSQGSVELFRKLNFEHLITIAEQQIQKDISLFSNSSNLKLSIEDRALVYLLTLSFAPTFDIRAIKSHISSLLIDPITDYIRKESKATALEHVKLKLSNSAKEFIKKTDFLELQKTLSLKHQTVVFKTKITKKSNTLYIIFDDIEITKLSFSKDIGMAGGIVVTLPEITFDQVAGHEFIKQRLKETISILKNKQRLKELDVDAPSGMLLYGPPGTGKTMLAQAFANEANLPFIACSGQDLLSGKFIEDIFQRARDYAPAIIFIDEIDALPMRGSMNAHADALINKLLTEISGFDTDDQEIFVIAATNLKEKLDPALIRSGRIDLHFKVPPLDKAARRWFIEKQLKHDLYSSNIDIEQVILVSAGLNGADLEKVHRESVLRAVRKNLSEIPQALLIEEINILKYGAKRSIESSQLALEETAYHEAAHAVISKTLIPERIIEQISVVAHENSLGMVSFDNEQELDHTKDFLFSMTCVALAGRAAQVKQFGSRGLDTGASSDLRQSMSLAWAATAKYGMEDKCYNMDIASLQEMSKLPLFQTRVESLIEDWIKKATVETNVLVDKHWSKIEAVAREVLEKEILDEKTLYQLMR